MNERKTYPYNVQLAVYFIFAPLHLVMFKKNVTRIEKDEGVIFFKFKNDI